MSERMKLVTAAVHYPLSGAVGVEGMEWVDRVVVTVPDDPVGEGRVRVRGREGRGRCKDCRGHRLA